MTRRSLFGALMGLLGTAAVGKMPVEAAEPVVTVPEALLPVLTAVTSSPACRDLTIASLEAALQEWRDGIAGIRPEQVYSYGGPMRLGMIIHEDYGNE